MTTFALNVGGREFAVEAVDPAQLAALSAVRERHNSGLAVEAEQAVEDHADYCADDREYLQWALVHWLIGNPDATEQELRDTVARALASYAGQNPPEVLVEPEAGPPSVNALIAYADVARSRFRDSGTSVTLGGQTIPVRTDRQTRDDVDSALLRSQNNPEWATKWKLSNGTFVTVNGAAIAAIADAIAEQWSDAYAREEQAVAAITAEPPTIADKAGIDKVFGR